jgi:hypothetical protein
MSSSSHRILLVNTSACIDFIKAEKNKYTQIYAVSVDEYVELISNNVECELLASLLSKSECLKIFNESKNLIEEIDLRIAACIKNGDINLFKIYKYNSYEYITELMALDLAIKKIYQNSPAAKIFRINLINSNKVNLDQHPTGVIMNDLFDLYDEIYPGKIKSVNVKIEIYFTRRFINKILDNFIEIILKTSINCLKIFNKIFYINNGYQNCIIALGYGSDSALSYKVATAIFPSKKIFITFKNKILSSVGIRKIPILKIDYLLPSLDLDILNFEKQFEIILQNLKIESFEINYLFQLRKNIILKAFYRSKQFEMIIHKFINSKFVVTNLNGLDERILEQLSYKYNIDVISNHHGWYAEPECYEYQSKVVVVKNALTENLIKNAFPAQNVNVLEVNNYKQIERQNNSSLKKILILSTGPRSGRVLNEFVKEDLMKYWAVIFEFCKEFGEIEIYVSSKNQPFDIFLQRNFTFKNLIYLDNHIGEKSIDVDLIIDLGKPSSAVYNALKQGIPIILCNGIYKFSRPLNNAIFNLYADHLVKDANKLKEVLYGLVTSYNSHISKIFENNKTLLNYLIK